MSRTRPEPLPPFGIQSPTSGETVSPGFSVYGDTGGGADPHISVSMEGGISPIDVYVDTMTNTWEAPFETVLAGSKTITATLAEGPESKSVTVTVSADQPPLLEIVDIAPPDAFARGKNSWTVSGKCHSTKVDKVVVRLTKKGHPHGPEKGIVPVNGKWSDDVPGPPASKVDGIVVHAIASKNGTNVVHGAKAYK